MNNQPENPMFSFAEKMVNTPKVVFSKPLKTVNGKNVVVENGDLVKAVNSLKEKKGKDLLIVWGSQFYV